MENNGIPLSLRNAIKVLKLVKHMLFRDLECKSIEDRVLSGEKKKEKKNKKAFFALKLFSTTFVLPLTIRLANSG